MKKNSINVVIRVAMGLLLWFAVTMAFSKLVVPILPVNMPEVIKLVLAQMVVPYTVGLGLFYLVAGKMEVKELQSEQKITIGLIIKSLLIQQLCAMPVMAVINIITIKLGGELAGVAMAESILGPNWLFYAVLLLIFNPIFEEFLFRKLALDRLLVLGKREAIIISAILFALPHAISQGIAQMCGTFIIALVWANIRVKTGKLWPCILLHSFFNFFSGYLVLALTKFG